MMRVRTRNSNCLCALPGFALLMVSMTLGLSGCREHEPRLDDITAANLNDPGKRHPIKYAGRTEALYVEVASDGLGLSENQAEDVFRFVDRYKSEAEGSLTITAPSSVRGHMAASRSFRDIEALVDRSGVPDEAVTIRRARSNAKFGPAVQLSYQRALAVPPACGNWPKDLGRIDRERLPYEDFGCASQRNLALTVANARDLNVPQMETPRYSEKRSATWSEYTGGGGMAGGESKPSLTSSGPAPAGN